ncbi:hypothetical protein LTS08_006799 [Lithohypha guttulata]|nr:hypothetical protein LTS08_006799 [Lithohypha guttulata]
MFRWYQNAEKCYVYLSEVKSEPGWEFAFENSRWFERGWTLQELLAPQEVDSFSSDKMKLGSKASLITQIHEITEIPELALHGEPLLQFPPAERLCWAKDRKTSVEEDEAYCLLGIFGVFMPLIYGEGSQHAKARLKKEYHSIHLTQPQVVKLHDSGNLSNRSFHRDQVDSSKTEISIGLTDMWEKMGFGRNIRTRANASASNCLLTIDSWPDTVLYRAGITLLALSQDNQDFQVGAWSNSSSCDWPRSTIKFPSPFKKPPRVLVWLSGFDAGDTQNLRIDATVADIRPESFQLHVTPWDASKLYFASATWIAYRADLKGVASGTIATLNYRVNTKIVASDDGIVKFEKPFPRAPKVAIAVNRLDYSVHRDLCFRAYVDNVTADGFQWKMSHEFNAVCFTAGLSWIALDTMDVDVDLYQAAFSRGGRDWECTKKNS